jgi:hypothetical protein
MTQTENVANTTASVEEIQQGWHELKSRVGQLEAEKSALEQENKTLHFLLERVIEHRQKSHAELVLLLTGLVSKLPINDIGVIVSKLVEHNAHVSEVCAALAKGKAEAALPQPAILKALDKTKRDLASALKPAVDELIQLDAPFETSLLNTLLTQPESFFSQAMTRANRCFIKGQVPRERIIREFGEQALIFFNDMTTDPKLNPRPKPDEIVMAFKNDFETLFQQNPALIPDKRQQLLALYQKIQRSKAHTEQARSQKNVFEKLSFILELLHYYKNQNIESPEVAFAQRLPVLIEQLVVTGPQDNLDEKLIIQAENLLAFIINPDHRQMVVNNIGKSGGSGKTLCYVLKLRMEKASDLYQVIPEFIKHLVPPKKVPRPETLAPTLRLINPDTQRLVVRAIRSYDRIRKPEAEALAIGLTKELGLTALDTEETAVVSVEKERQLAWEKIKQLIASRAEPAAIAAAIRARLHARYNSDEIKQSWLTLTEADPMSLIRTFCQLPYLPDGKTDAIAQPVLETYVIRLMHEKYAATHTKVVNSLKNMFKAKPDSPTLLNFLALVKWVDAESANKLRIDIGMPATAQ